MMKKLFCLLFIITGLLSGQQKPFAYWHAQWSNTSQLPSNFTARWDNSTEEVLFDISGFPSAAYSVVTIVGKQGSYPINDADGDVLFSGTDVVDPVVAQVATGTFNDGETWYCALYVTEDGKGQSTGSKKDTVYIGVPPQNDSLYIVSVIGNSNNSNTITWRSVSDADSYLLYYWTEIYQHSYTYGYKGYALLHSTTDTTYTHTGLYDGQEVFYVVKAVTGTDTVVSTMKSGYPTRSSGTTRHVSSTGTGTWAQATDMSTPCSFATWKTNSTALAKGDSVLFKRGDSFILGESMVAINGLRGTYLNPIVLGAYGTGNAPTFRRTAQNYIFVIDKGFYITVQDLHFNPVAGSSQNWVAIGGDYRSPSDIDTISYLKFKRNIFEGGTPGITFYFWGNWREDSSATKSWLYGDYLQSVVQYLEIGHNTFTNATGSDNDNINLGGNIDYNWIHHNRTDGTTDGDGIDCMGGRNILIEYNKVSNTARHSFKVMAQRGPNYGLIFRGNVSHRTGNGYQGIEIAGGVGVTYYNNTVPSMSFAGDPGGQISWAVGRDSVFKDIVTVNNAFYGYEASVPYLSSATNYSLRFHSYHTVDNISWGNPKGLGLIAGNTWMHNLWYNAGWGTGGVTGFINRDHIGGVWQWTCCSIPGYSSTGNDAGGFAGYTVASYFSGLSGTENTGQIIGSPAMLIDSSSIDGLSPAPGSPLIYAGLNDNVNYPYWVDATGDSILTGYRSIGAYNETSPFYAISFTTPFAFGSVNIDTDTTRTLYIRNTGNQSIVIDSMKVGYSGKFSISESPNQTIGIGDSIAVAVTFNRTAVGSWTDSLQIYLTSISDTRAVLTGTVTQPQPSAPRSFIATQTGTTQQLNIKATLFDNTPVAKDTIIVIAKVGSAPTSRTDGIQLYKGTDTTAVNDDTFTNAAFADVIVHAACYVRSTNGEWLSEPARDTALVGTYTPPDEGDLFNITFEGGNLSEFNSTVIDGGSSVQDSVKSQGTYAWEILTDSDEITGNPTYGQITFASRGTTVVRFDLWIPSGVPTDLTYSNTHFVSISAVDPNQGYHEAGFGFGHFGFGGTYNLRWLRYGRETNGDYEYEDTYWDADYRGQWVEAEVGWIQHASTGGSYIKINGTAIDNELIYNTTSRTVNRISIGHTEGEALDTGLRWRFDNIRVYSAVP